MRTLIDYGMIFVGVILGFAIYAPSDPAALATKIAGIEQGMYALPVVLVAVGILDGMLQGGDGRW